jgi:nitrogen fixation NifU-like protein
MSTQQKKMLMHSFTHFKKLKWCLESNMDDLYQEIILDHARSPHNKGVLKVATHTIKGSIASCGDSVQMQLVVNVGVVSDLIWQGDGCAISTASTILISDLLIEKSIS